MSYGHLIVNMFFITALFISVARPVVNLLLPWHCLQHKVAPLNLRHAVNTGAFWQEGTVLKCIEKR